MGSDFEGAWGCARRNPPAGGSIAIASNAKALGNRVGRWKFAYMMGSRLSPPDDKSYEWCAYADPHWMKKRRESELDRPDPPDQMYTPPEEKIHVRMLLRVSIPVEGGNAAAKNGTLGSTVERILADLKPEAAYFSWTIMATDRVLSCST